MQNGTRTTLIGIALLLAIGRPAMADRANPVTYESGSDPDELSPLVSTLERMAKSLHEGSRDQADDYKNGALGLAPGLWSKPSDEVKRSPKFAKLRAWQMALEREVVQKIGSDNATAIYGDGKRVTKIDGDLRDAAKEALEACLVAANTSNTASGQQDVKGLDESYQKYQAKLDRVMKADPAALRWTGVEDGAFVRDNLSAFMACEWTIAGRRALFEDYYTRDESRAEKFKGCGYEEWTLSTLVTRRGGGGYHLDGIPSVNGYATSCSKLPKRTKLPGNLKSVALREIPGARQKGRVLTVYGKNTIRRGLDHYKLVGIRMWGKDITLTTSDCGEKDPKLVCEASGSKTVFTFNALAHYLDRADHHKAAGRAEKCKEMLGEARKSAEEWTKFYEDAKKSGEWSGGLTYMTKKHGRMNEKQIVAKVEELGRLAEERAIGYCGKKGRAE
jgi:hypothetical protein